MTSLNASDSDGEVRLIRMIIHCGQIYGDGKLVEVSDSAFAANLGGRGPEAEGRWLAKANLEDGGKRR